MKVEVWKLLTLQGIYVWLCRGSCNINQNKAKSLIRLFPDLLSDGIAFELILLYNACSLCFLLKLTIVHVLQTSGLTYCLFAAGKRNAHLLINA